MNEQPSDMEVEEREKNEQRQNRLLDDFTVPPDHWKKIGFWRVLGDPLDREKAFEKLLKEYHEYHADQTKRLAANHEWELTRFKSKVIRARNRIKVLDDQLTEQRDTTGIRTEIVAIRGEIDTLENHLVSLYKQLGAAKATLIRDQINEVFADLAEISKRYDSIKDELDIASEKVLSRNPEALNIKPNLLKDLKEENQQTLKSLKNRLEHFSKSGAGYFSRSRLIGYGTAVAAGWFFSVFAVSKQLSNQDVPFFLITGFFGFGEILKRTDFLTTLLNHIVFVGIVLVSIFAISGICYFLMDRLEKKALFSRFFFELLFGGSPSRTDSDVNSADAKQVEKEVNPPSSAGVSSKMFLTFWIETIPFLLILGIIFIVLSMGTDDGSNNLNQLSISLSAQAVGVAISLGLAGLSYLYITNVIEPRLEGSRKASVEPRWLYLNVELALVIIAMIVIVIAILFGVNSALALSANNFFSLTMFVLCCLISSVTLGYGVYFAGLHETVNYLETKIQYLAVGTAYNSFPNIRLAIRMDYNFRKSCSELVDKLLRLEHRKAKLAERFYSSEDHEQTKKRTQKQVKKQQKKIDHYWKQFKNFFKSIGEASDLPNADNLSQEERVEQEVEQIETRFETLVEDREYFPELTCEIENAKGRLNGRVRRRIELEIEEKSRLDERSFTAKKIRDEIIDLESKIGNWEKYSSVLSDIQLEEVDLLFERQKETLYLLADGIHLGMIFSAGPSPSPPPTSTNGPSPSPPATPTNGPAPSPPSTPTTEMPLAPEIRIDLETVE